MTVIVRVTRRTRTSVASSILSWRRLQLKQVSAQSLRTHNSPALIFFLEKEVSKFYTSSHESMSNFYEIKFGQ